MTTLTGKDYKRGPLFLRLRLNGIIERNRARKDEKKDQSEKVVERDAVWYERTAAAVCVCVYK